MTFDLTVQATVMELAIEPVDGPEIVMEIPAGIELVLTPQGMSGPPGPSGEFLASVATEAISALRVVASTSGGVDLVDPSILSSVSRIVGVSVHAAASGAALTVRRSGIMSDPAWSWTPGQPLFAGAAGVLTAVAPSSVAIRQVAVAVDATTILIDLSDLILME